MMAIPKIKPPLPPAPTATEALLMAVQHSNGLALSSDRLDRECDQLQRIGEWHWRVFGLASSATNAQDAASPQAPTVPVKGALLYGRHEACRFVMGRMRQRVEPGEGSSVGQLSHTDTNSTS